MQDIIFLHGAIGAKDQLEPLAALFSDYRVHLISFSGHGKTPLPEQPFSIPLFAEQVLVYIRENKLEKTVVLGNSMGGYVALYIARHHPTVFEKVITLGTKFTWDAATATKETKLLDPDTIRQKVPAFAAQLEKRHGDNWELLLAKTRELLVGIGNNNELKEEDYPVIECPCLLLSGDRDKTVPPEETLHIGRLLKNGKAGILPGTPHPIEQADVETVALLVKKFVG